MNSLHRLIPRSSPRFVAAGVLITLLLSAFPAFAQQRTYVVRPGDSLFQIALNHGVDVNTLAQVNNIANTWRIYAGQTLIIPSPNAAPAPVPAAQPRVHTVQRGENLAQIAARYGLTPEELATLNGLANPNMIYAGQELLVTAPLAVENEAPPLTAAGVVLVTTTHVVQPGESLSMIGQQYGVSWMSIAQVNNLYNADQVFAGQTLIIPAFDLAANTDGPMLTAWMDASTAPPAPTGIGREILVDLSDSRVYAYENGILMRNVLVSTGLPATPTVQGDFTIQRTYVSQTMTGPGYYLPDVPYVMYFYEGYALHGTYWHSNWGQPMSHGCVNMPTPEAEWLFSWAEVGTPVRVQA